MAMTNYLGWSLALLSGAADATSRGVIKLTSTHTFILNAAGGLVGFPLYILFVALTGIPAIQPLFWWALLFAVPTNMLAKVLTVEAHRHRNSPLVLITPHMALSPALLAISSPILGGGTPNKWGVMGIVLLVAGAYLLNTQGIGEKITMPLRRALKGRGSRLIIIVSIIYGMNSNFDKWGIDGSNATFWLLSFQTAGGIGFLCLTILYRILGRMQKSECNIINSWRTLFLYGLCGAAINTPQTFALKLIGVVPYIIAGKRAGTILLSAGLGLTLAFLPRFQKAHHEEKEYWQYRLPGVLLIVSGMTAIILWG